MTQTDPNKPYSDPTLNINTEELQVVGEQLLAKVKELVHEGNVRRIIIKQDGHTIVEIPLSLGVAGVLLAPIWASVGVLGALLAQCSIEVIRQESPIEKIEEKVEELKEDVDPSNL